eukprot:Hpha_TRINITY_DN16344_c1_g11::TRINITY_DN16344_c1_g11_i2::g.61213::m.61213
MGPVLFAVASIVWAGSGAVLRANRTAPAGQAKSNKKSASEAGGCSFTRRKLCNATSEFARVTGVGGWQCSQTLVERLVPFAEGRADLKRIAVGQPAAARTRPRKPKWILFVGDSNMRFVFFAVSKYLNTRCATPTSRKSPGTEYFLELDYEYPRCGGSNSSRFLEA